MKRILAVGATLLALVALPAAAQAYPAPPVAAAVSDPSPAVGETISITADGLVGAETATLTVVSTPASIPDSAITIAGTAALTKDVVNESVTFAFSASQDGIYTATITTDNGLTIPAQVITVGNPQIGGGTGSGSGSGSGSTGGSASTGGLANTGASVGGLAALAGGLLVVGAGGTYLVKRGSRSNA
ncbi:hypothetical protein [Serinibacter arcticus]|uniref:Gram-positive cocci surface proteins LPxTG domain-containing protein n=1 Tax=Serinibacter arcticus TaxID=1655435 RepID=A0A4Z1E1Q3_9MICO|nr:hypothetical protein [Serinibacter arcticus]TGO05796.1 hypothetical protein SERN_1800 [Serinibacter arcticus]